jgi:hypothetical protein
MKAFGAQQAIAHGLSTMSYRSSGEEGKDTYSPQNPTILVANLKECAKGAKTIAQENIKCPHIQALRRSGLYFWNLVAIPAMAAGGRGVKLSSVGDLISRGKMRAPTNVTKEKTTRDMLPILPMSPSTSFDCLTS